MMRGSSVSALRIEWTARPVPPGRVSVDQRGCVVRGGVEPPTFRFSVLRMTVHRRSPGSISPVWRSFTTARGLPRTSANETETETAAGHLAFQLQARSATSSRMTRIRHGHRSHARPCRARAGAVAPVPRAARKGVGAALSLAAAARSASSAVSSATMQLTTMPVAAADIARCRRRSIVRQAANGVGVIRAESEIKLSSEPPALGKSFPAPSTRAEPPLAITPLRPRRFRSRSRGTSPCFPHGGDADFCLKHRGSISRHPVIGPHILTVRNRNLSGETRTVPPNCAAIMICWALVHGALEWAIGAATSQGSPTLARSY